MSYLAKARKKLIDAGMAPYLWPLVEKIMKTSYRNGSGAAVVRVRDTMLEEVRKADADARYHYPCATIQVNAPLALEQLVMETRVDLCQRLLAMLDYEGPEMKVKPRRGK